MRKIILFLCFLAVFSFSFAQEISNNIRSLVSSEGRILFGEEPNSIMVTDYPENIERIAAYLDVIDTQPQQVLIEARLVEVKLQKEHSLGVNWQLFANKGGFEMGQFKVFSEAAVNGLQQQIPYKPTYYPPGQTTSGVESPFTVTIFDENINVVLKALANSLDTNILSAPRVTTVNNREAEIKIIKRLPWAEPQVSMTDTNVAITWNVNFEEEGIVLKVLPTINDDNKITMILKPEVSEKVDDYPLTVIQGTTEVPYTVPIIDRRTASTKVVIGNGQTLIIGGLIKERAVSGSTKIPFFGDWPVLGHLFKSSKEVKEKSELLIFVSPTIITPDEFLRMARQEKYRLGSSYIKEREKEADRLLLIEEQDKEQEDKANEEFESLSERQKALIAERKKLKEDIFTEKKSVDELKKTLDKLINNRKELERSKSK